MKKKYTKEKKIDKKVEIVILPELELIIIKP